MAPTPQEIKSLLEGSISQDVAAKKGSTGNLNQPALAKHFHDNIDLHIHGQGFQHATHLKGAAAVKAAAAEGGSHADLSNLVDYSKPYDARVLQVIGGGQQTEWAAAVLKATGTAVNGKAFDHEWVMTLQFDNNGKITHLKNYADTLHIHNTLQGI
ncbi:hypothetical protein DL767_009136 [Monosporascus sp. MG133]|nr:hypothetical protein DL767_009136 [Monosporascus sp. MG133]